MSAADLILGSIAIGAPAIEGLHLFATRAREARQLKKECLRLGNLAVVLLAAITKNKEVLKQVESTKELQKLTQDLLGLLTFCLQEWTTLQKAWEVMWKRRIPNMTKLMWTYLHLCIFESNVSAWSELQSLDRGVEAVMRNIQAVKQDTSASLDILKAQRDPTEAIENLARLTDELEQASKEQPSSTSVAVDFDANDRRLELMGEKDGKKLFGILHKERTRERVICIPIDAEEMRKGQKGPRHVEIYRRISIATLVQPFYGIKMQDQQPYAVMQDLRDCPTLASFIASKEYPKHLPGRLRLAHDLASTLVYLHEAQILVKNLGDNVISLVKKSERSVPVICDLEQARLFLEPTTSVAYDVRYEAPEYTDMETHSKYTDVWSLGVLIWQCITAHAPFEIREPVKPSSVVGHNLRKRIVTRRREDFSLPFINTGLSSLPGSVQELIHSCCNPIPPCRTPAAQVAQELFDIWARLSIDLREEIMTDTRDLPSVEREAWRVLSHKRDDKTFKAKLPAQSVDTLRDAAAHGKAISAFLFGALTFYGIIDIDNPIDTGDDVFAFRNSLEETRARAAIPHLEFAVAAGVSEATKEIGYAYASLARLYIRQHERSTRSQSQH